jgi:hypothetical protein
VQSSTRHSPSPPQRGHPTSSKVPRRQTTLAPTAPIVLPPGIRLAYDARLALGRLWQLYRRIIQAPSLPDGYRWRSDPMPQAVRDLAADCGLTVGPNPGRVVVNCPRCHAQVYVLRGSGYGWACRRCDGQRWPQLEVSLATYGMGLVVGFRGRPMVLRRNRLMVALRRCAVRPRRYDDLVLLALGAPLLQFSPHWPRRRRDGRRPGPPNPLLRRLGTLCIEATIDNLLHATAFFERFGRG